MRGSSAGDVPAQGPFDVDVFAGPFESADSSDQIRFLGTAVLDAKCGDPVDGNQSLALGRRAPGSLTTWIGMPRPLNKTATAYPGNCRGRRPSPNIFDYSQPQVAGQSHFAACLVPPTSVKRLGSAPVLSSPCIGQWRQGQTEFTTSPPLPRFGNNMGTTGRSKLQHRPNNPLYILASARFATSADVHTIVEHPNQAGDTLTVQEPLD